MGVMWRQIQQHPIRFFALICVMATSAYLGVLAWRLVDTLAGPDWCSKALQAERITARDTFVGLTACVDLLKLQLEALALNSHIVIGTFALCLAVLIVIVIAGARLAGEIMGNKIDVSRQDPAAAADHVVEGAEQAAAEVKGTG